ncbi:MAG: imidazolonepropionase [Gemmataceae bacterium]|nr:imidazolonepropionase [Gemmataceae bacterium]MDW8267073.1 imidazolonepropionase [Gemmataceae bacterium]
MTLCIRNAAQLVTVAQSGERVKRGAALRNAGVIENGALVIEGERITWVGRTSELPGLPRDAQVLDATGKVVLPGFIDSHTHLIFAGLRVDEFEQRLLGRTYQEIAAGGGGIQATVRLVRQATRHELKQLARRRLGRFLEFGVTTVEIKSGYGLSVADEIKSLEVIAELNAEGPLELVPTFLGAHAVPAEFRNDREGYLHLLLDEMLPEVARRGLAEFCDVFCETGVFSLQESRRILRRASELGLRPKLHADELTPLGGAELAAELRAVSADHLLCVSEAGISALAEAGVVATLLPGTAFFLGLAYAPARKLIDGGAVVALASDCNPGTCPTENLPLIGAMACAQMKMLPAETITALTLHAAAALGRADRLGSLEPGKQADVIMCDIPDYRLLFYHFGVNHVERVVKRGRVVHVAGAGTAAGAIGCGEG